MPSVFIGHTLCRPPRDAIDVVRLGLDGQWREDNGQHGLAFVGGMPETPRSDAIIWVTDCKCKMINDCPLGAAMERAGAFFVASTIERRRAYRKPKKPKSRK